jgi:hypothetical protein
MLEKLNFNYRTDKNTLITYIRNGTPDERIRAMCYLGNSKENYDLYWEIFICDENTRVRGEALVASLYSNPEKIWEIVDHLIKTNNNKNERYLSFIIKWLNRIHKLKDTEKYKEKLKKIW